MITGVTAKRLAKSQRMAKISVINCCVDNALKSCESMHPRYAKNVARSGKNVFNPTLPHPWKEMATNGIDSNVFPTECEVELFEIKKELFKKKRHGKS